MAKRRRARRGRGDFDTFLNYRKPTGLMRFIGRLNPNDTERKNYEAARSRLESEKPSAMHRFMNALVKPASWAAEKLFGKDAVDTIKQHAEQGRPWSAAFEGAKRGLPEAGKKLGIGGRRKKRSRRRS